MLLKIRKHWFNEQQQWYSESQESTGVGVTKIKVIGLILDWLQFHAVIHVNILQLQAYTAMSRMYRHHQELNKLPEKWLKHSDPTDSGRTPHLSGTTLVLDNTAILCFRRSCIYFPLSVLADCFTGTHYTATNLFEKGRKQIHTKEIHYPRDMSQLMLINQTFFPSCRKPGT